MHVLHFIAAIKMLLINLFCYPPYRTYNELIIIIIILSTDLTDEMVRQIVNTLANYSDYVLDLVAKALELKYSDFSAYRDKGKMWVVLEMLTYWRVNNVTKDESPSRVLARKFLSLREVWKTEGQFEESKPKFKQLARNLDVTSKSVRSVLCIHSEHVLNILITPVRTKEYMKELEELFDATKED